MKIQLPDISEGHWNQNTRMPRVVQNDGITKVCECERMDDAKAIAALPQLLTALAKIAQWEPMAYTHEAGGMSIMDAIGTAKSALIAAGATITD